jgi:hypothetical protein
LAADNKRQYINIWSILLRGNTRKWSALNTNIFLRLNKPYIYGVDFMEFSVAVRSPALISTTTVSRDSRTVAIVRRQIAEANLACSEMVGGE